MAAVNKANKKEIEEKEKPVETKPEETKTEPVVISDVVTETTERIEVIEEVTPQEANSEKKMPDESTLPEDPLTDFKEKMNEEEEQSVSSSPPQKNYMWPIFFVFIISLALIGGIFVYKNNMKSEKVNVVTLSPTPTVMPEPTKAIDFSKYSIKILNGSEIDGEAGRQKDNLEGKGFTVSSIGNAGNSDYTKTIVQAKEAVELAYLNKLKSVLEESFVVGEMEELPEDADSDVVVIIGSQTN